MYAGNFHQKISAVNNITVEESHLSMIRKLYQLFMRVHSMLTIATFVCVLCCLSICLSVCPLMSICLSRLFMSVCLCLCLYAHFSVCSCLCLVCLSFCSCLRLSVLLVWQQPYIETTIQRHQQIYYICLLVFSHACLSPCLFLCIIML